LFKLGKIHALSFPTKFHNPTDSSYSEQAEQIPAIKQVASEIMIQDNICNPDQYQIYALITPMLLK